MSSTKQEESAWTSFERGIFSDSEASTSPSIPRRRRRGRLMASLVLGAMMAVPAGEVQAPIDTWFRRRDEITESGTSEREVDPVLHKRVRQMFEKGSDEFFHDGVSSEFSRSLLRFLRENGSEGFRAIADYALATHTNPDVVSEALRWIADFEDPSTLPQRWGLLEQSLKSRSSKIRDGAILGFSAIDNPKARRLLQQAQEVEKIGELRVLINQVLAQLERDR